MKESDRPFANTLVRLMDEELRVGIRELVRRTKSRDNWGSNITYVRLRSGEISPTMAAMEVIAGALGVRPEVFAEYRLGKARAKLDPDQVGLPQALKNLKRHGFD